jgi:hypothetical protein
VSAILAATKRIEEDDVDRAPNPASLGCGLAAKSLAQA